MQNLRCFGFITSALLVTFAVGCGDDSGTKICVPGATQVCTCTSGVQGAQTCNAAGNLWLDCQCSGTDHGVPDMGVDGPRPLDTGADQRPPVDQRVPDGPRADGPRLDGPRADGAAIDSAMLIDGPRPPDAMPGDFSGGVGLHGACSAPLVCQTGHLCLSYDPQLVLPPVCYQDCTTAATVCAANTDGRTTCEQANATSSICVEVVATNGACDIAKSKVCGANDQCKNGTCVPLTVGSLFAPCAGSTGTICGTGQTCVQTSGALTHGHCLDNCNPTTTACTTATQAGECVALSTAGSGACVPNGTQAHDKVCGQDEGKAYDPALDCNTGATCLTFTTDAAKGLCLPVVAACGATACTAGRTCLDLTTGGACAEDCSTSTTVCTANGKNCSQVTATQSVCTPAGSAAFGTICSASTLCAPTLTCLTATSSSANGFCTQVCGGTATCPATPAGATCTQITATDSLCLFPCGQAGQTCPTGLTCQAAGTGTSFCLAP